METNEKILIASSVIGLVFLLAWIIGLYWLYKVRARRSAHAALEGVEITGIAGSIGAVQFSADEILGPAGVTEPNWDGDVVILDTSAAVTLCGIYPSEGPQGALYRALGIGGRNIERDVKRKVCKDGIALSMESFTASGMNWAFMHLSPDGLHLHDLEADPGKEVRDALRSAADAVFSNEVVQCVDGMRRDWTPEGRNITLLVQLPFSRVHESAMSEVEQAKYFAKCLARAAASNEFASSGVKIKVCCGNEVLRTACDETVRKARSQAR